MIHALIILLLQIPKETPTPTVTQLLQQILVESKLTNEEKDRRRRAELCEPFLKLGRGCFVQNGMASPLGCPTGENADGSCKPLKINVMGAAPEPTEGK